MLTHFPPVLFKRLVVWVYTSMAFVCIDFALALVVSAQTPVAFGEHAAVDLSHGMDESRIVAGQGIMVGEVTQQSAILQLRLTTTDQLIDGDVPGVAGVVQFTLTEFGGGTPMVKEAAAMKIHDFIVRVVFQNLRSDTEYTCSTRLGRDREHLAPGPQAKFRTLGGAECIRPTRFVVVTGMNYDRYHNRIRANRQETEANAGEQAAILSPSPEQLVGYPALKTIQEFHPDFFVGTGDNVYYDTPKVDRAKTAQQMRRKWHEQFVQSRYRRLFSVVPTYWEIDDHDFRVDDCDLTGDYAPLPALGRAIMLEQLPYGPINAVDQTTYRTHRVSRDLQIWLTENRWHRSPNAMPDGPEKSVWGKEQKAWLKRTLQQSTATFKLLISPTPLIGPDDLRKKDNHTNIGGFRHERDEFFSWLNEEEIVGDGFFVICGDRHWQYHSLHPSGIEEFSCGALVDANSRLGRKPGDPKSTDPQGTIQQLYYQQPASGGFLLVEVRPADDQRPATLTFHFHDEHGKALYETTKVAGTQ
jgi:alkaline phosphatase D